MKFKKQIILFIIILVISSMFTYSAITTSHALDSYCTMCNGYKETAVWFIQNGRIFSFLFYMFFDYIDLSFDMLRPISIITSNIIITINIIILYNEINKKFKIKNNFYRVLSLMLLFLIYYTPLTPSILVLDEAFIINLGILFLTISSIFLLKKGLKNYFIALLLAIFGFSSYQGLSSHFFITLFVLIISDFEKRQNIEYYLKKFILAIIVYGLAFVSNLGIIKIVSFITKKNITKLGNLIIVDNIKKILCELIPNSYKYLFGYINSRYYYLLVVVLFVIAIMYIMKNKNKINNILLLILLVSSCAFTSFIPNIFMNSASNYIEARMALTVGIIPVIILVYIFYLFDINKRIMSILSIISCICLVFSFFSIYQNMNVDKKRYQSDLEYIEMISKNIKEYEEENISYVDTIYYMYDLDVAYYYHFGNANDTNIRLMAIDWALDCAISSKLDRKINFIKMSDEKANELFGNVNYDGYEEQQIFFENNILYLLIY